MGYNEIMFSKRLSMTVLCLLAFGLPLLGGCSSNEALRNFLFEADYTLSGLPQDEAAAESLQEFFDNDVAAIPAPTDEKSEKDYAASQQNALRERLLEKLYADGYFDAQVRFVKGKEVWQGDFSVIPGARYHLSTITMRGAKPDETQQKIIATLDEFKNQPVVAEKILLALAEVSKQLDDKSCRYGLSVEHAVYLDRAAKTAELELTFSAGRKATMSAVSFKGQRTVKDSYLEKLVNWQEGDCYKNRHVEDLRGALFQSGLFSSVSVEQPARPARNGRIDVNVTLTERAHRSINAGMTYYSDEGPGVSLGWRHRNLLGGAELLEATLRLSAIQQSLQARLTSPFFLRTDQKISATAEIGNEETDAYDRRAIETGVAVTRQINKRLSLGTGVNLSFSRTDDNATLQTENFGLVSLPQTLTYDSRNNLLDPRRGWFIEANAEPFINILGSASPFMRVGGTVRRYQPLGDDTVIAARAKAGSIQGASLTDVPAAERFYAGGSGSVRGFGYQDIGPQRNGDPTGGRGLAEGSLEIRHRINEDYGVVAFVDAGSLSEDSAPEFSDVAVGGGIGLRYYTAVGPVRFDVAAPLTDNDITADPVQFYISLGQSF